MLLELSHRQRRASIEVVFTECAFVLGRRWTCGNFTCVGVDHGVSRERHRAMLAGDELSQTRARKLSCLVPKMLLHRPRNTGSVGRDELDQRVVKLQQGHWAQLLLALQKKNGNEGARQPRAECRGDRCHEPVRS